MECLLAMRHVLFEWKPVTPEACGVCIALVRAAALGRLLGIDRAPDEAGR